MVATGVIGALTAASPGLGVVAAQATRAARTKSLQNMVNEVELVDSRTVQYQLIQLRSSKGFLYPSEWTLTFTFCK